MKPECSLNSHQVCLALGVHFTALAVECHRPTGVPHPLLAVHDRKEGAEGFCT